MDPVVVEVIDPIVQSRLVALVSAFKGYIETKDITPMVFGIFTGAITKELCNFAEFHAGYQSALARDITKDEFVKVDEELLSIIVSQGRISAIKHYRKLTGLSLREARDYVFALAERNNIP